MPTEPTQIMSASCDSVASATVGLPRRIVVSTLTDFPLAATASCARRRAFSPYSSARRSLSADARVAGWTAS